MNDWAQRKPLRLQGYDYSRGGYYFVTVCTAVRGENILAEICSGLLAVGAAALGGPSAVDTGTSEDPWVALTAIGEVVAQNIEDINHVYNGRVSVDCSVIMPDHIHLIIRIHDAVIQTPVEGWGQEVRNGPPGGEPVRRPGDGPPRAAAPTVALPKIVNTLKGLTSRKAGYPLWQRGYYEHIIRNDEDLENTRQYIRDNPWKWLLNQCQDDPAP
nr:transposase [uncultured Oscillibacter sp.]